ncbi:short-chain fatty acyl-CoA regulator family protein [Aureimonas altamirensis]|uniref:helix-turn-helix domain-containing protein n=1 Tax=Aureimonas altamirensis TaxID=370622 RepID=UPI002036FE4C|nr:helix-turn-helix transcriptional regulator [Aureimonas altamirensis]MCM2502086.1 short-chain fatty acyl-CoA regulator family protein [Aureimonas altamirensis]
MADNKVFAGPRLRRLRNGLGLTQTAMAAELGISPSYLNLLERNQRPLTVQILLRLTEIYEVDLSGLQAREGDSLRADLKAAFADPLLAGELPGPQEMSDFADAAPNAAAGMAKLYRAYKEMEARLSDLSVLLAGQGKALDAAGSRLPMDAVREVLEDRPNYFAGIDGAAEGLSAEIALGDDAYSALKTWLRTRYDVSVRVLPVETMPNWRRRFDRHSRRLFLSERLSAPDRLREVAFEAASLALAQPIEAELASFSFASAEARRLALFELTRYAAHALMMPYGPFHAAAERAAYDIDALAGRFQASFEQVANRLTTLQRHGAPGVPFFMMEVDQAGNRFRRAGAQGFPTRRFGGGCVKLAIHNSFSEAGRVLVEEVEMPDGAVFLTISRTLEGLKAGFAERPRRTALLLACEAAFKDRVIYGRFGRMSPVPVGPSCRLCERQACLARAEPPLTRPLGLDTWVGGLSAFDF